MTPDEASELACTHCSGPLTAAWRAEVRQFRAKHGKEVRDPKLCARCFWKALLGTLNDTPEEPPADG